MTTSAAPVGVFDSGVGGLSVLHEIRRVLPAEDLIYVADSAHCPYGGLSRLEIQQRAHALSRFLIEQHAAKAVVVACNTATAAAIDELRRCVPGVPFVGMEPALKPAAALTRSGVVGVLATAATLGADRFAQLVERVADGVEVWRQPCPGLVTQVEAGDLDGPRTRELLQRYVAPLLARGADTLVLGCTHYPFLRPALLELVGPSVEVLDSGAAVARQLQRVLAQHRLQRHGGAAGQLTFYTTAPTSAPTLQRLWGAPVPIAHLQPLV